MPWLIVRKHGGSVTLFQLRFGLVMAVLCFMRYRFPPLPKLLISLQLFACPAFAGTPAQEMAEAANNFLAALTPEQKAKAVFDFKDEQRFDWHFIPKPRKGLPFKEMTTPQRALAHTLLSSGLSVRGLIKATNIMSLEYILFDLESQSPTRDAGLYFVTIFGKPG